MTNKAEAISIFEDKCKKKVANISNPRTGFSSQTYKITDTTGDVYYFKKGNDNYKLQLLINNELNNRGVKTPKIVICDKFWIIEEGVNGTKLDIKSRDLTNKTLEVFGKQLALVHKIITKGFGPLVSIENGKFQTYAEYFTHFRHLIHKKYTSLVDGFVNTNHITCLNHGDVSQSHIYIDSKGNYISLIDWDDVVSAPRVFDLSELLVNLNYDKEYWDSFMKGYTKYFDYVDINNKELLISALLQNYESYYWNLKDKRESQKKIKEHKDKIKILEAKIDQW